MIRVVFTAGAVVDIGVGLGLLVAPDLLLSIYGLATDRDGLFFCRCLGGTLRGFGVLIWLARGWPDTDARRVLTRVLALTASLGFLIAAAYQLQPGVPAATAVFAGLTLVFAVAWGFLAYRTFR
jgi:hypothetical protein